MSVDKLTKSIYQGKLYDFLLLMNNRKLLGAYDNESWDFNYKVEKFFKDITRRVNNASFLEMLLCDLYGIQTDYERFSSSLGEYISEEWEEFRDWF